MKNKEYKAFQETGYAKKISKIDNYKGKLAKRRKPYLDYDGDGKVNKYDCQPHNRKKQDAIYQGTMGLLAKGADRLGFHNKATEYELAKEKNIAEQRERKQEKEKKKENLRTELFNLKVKNKTLYPKKKATTITLQATSKPKGINLQKHINKQVNQTWNPIKGLTITRKGKYKDIKVPTIQQRKIENALKIAKERRWKKHGYQPIEVY